MRGQLQVMSDTGGDMWHLTEVTYREIYPSMVHDGQSDKRHDSDAHQEVADGQVHDQHRRHRVESLGCSDNRNDKNITYT